MKPVVKRKGVEQKFDERKVYATAYASCLNVPLSQKECEKIAEKVCKDIKVWIKGKKAVTSHSIHLAVNRSMKKYSEKAAFMYDTHRDIS